MIYSSDLLRAITTTQLIMNPSLINNISNSNPSSTYTSNINPYNNHIITSPLLKEISFGIRENLPKGTSVKEAKEIIAQKTNQSITNIQDNCETIASVIKRQEEFLNEMFSNLEMKYKNELIDMNHIPKVLVVSHGGFIRTFLRHFGQMDSIDKIHNCSLSKVIIERNEITKEFSFVINIEHINVISHWEQRYESIDRIDKIYHWI